jgi:hypothetical protein
MTKKKVFFHDNSLVNVYREIGVLLHFRKLWCLVCHELVTLFQMESIQIVTKYQILSLVNYVFFMFKDWVKGAAFLTNFSTLNE